ncbi:MAG: hypothetical protein JXJ04_12180 [Spirochaetales bacterium]|nr:hypothetical protein [Spirochaetales bacterium]
MQEKDFFYDLLSEERHLLWGCFSLFINFQDFADPITDLIRAIMQNKTIGFYHPATGYPINSTIQTGPQVLPALNCDTFMNVRNGA